MAKYDFQFCNAREKCAQTQSSRGKSRSQRDSQKGCGMILGPTRLAVCTANRTVRGRVTAGQLKPTARGCTFVVRFLRLQ